MSERRFTVDHSADAPHSPIATSIGAGEAAENLIIERPQGRGRLPSAHALIRARHRMLYYGSPAVDVLQVGVDEHENIVLSLT